LPCTTALADVPTTSAQKKLAVNLADVAHTLQPRATICCETGP